MPSPRVLIGTLFVDENEFDDCKRALSGQSYTNWDQRVIAGLPNREAHRALYNVFMEKQADYQLFVKLDADMILASPRSLAQIVCEFEQHKDLDHAVFYVHDWISDMPIIGLHVFSNRVYWECTEEQLFVDPDPRRPGQKRVYDGPPSPIANHSPDPLPYQAFRFGVHRTSKILQSTHWWVDSAQADFQWRLLLNIWKTYQQKGDRRRLLALLGAQWLWSRKQHANPGSYTSSSVVEAFRGLEQYGTDRLESMLSPAWHSRKGRLWMRYRGTAFRSAISVLGRASVRATRRLRRTLSKPPQGT